MSGAPNGAREGEEQCQQQLMAHAREQEAEGTSLITGETCREIQG
jgi:hypothetical protein